VHVVAPVATMAQRQCRRHVFAQTTAYLVESLTSGLTA
jgi:hypothetical protein